MNAVCAAIAYLRIQESSSGTPKPCNAMAKMPASTSICALTSAKIYCSAWHATALQGINNAKFATVANTIASSRADSSDISWLDAQGVR